VAVISALALCGFYLVLFIIRPSGMGLGDVKLAASVGAALGWIGWRAVVEGTFLTFALAAVYGVALLLLRRATRTTQLPLGPFIVLGTLAAIAALPKTGTRRSLGWLGRVTGSSIAPHPMNGLGEAASSGWCDSRRPGSRLGGTRRSRRR
jgi:hypothetical protein